MSDLTDTDLAEIEKFVAGLEAAKKIARGEA